MIVKKTAVIEITKKEMYFACGVVEAEFNRIGYPCTITSGSDSHESKPDSLHHSGLALDFRVKHIPIVTKNTTIARIRLILNPKGFDTIHESVGKENEHLHVEFQPKENEMIFKKEE